MFSLSVLSASLLPVKAQRNTNNMPSSALEQAIVSKVTQDAPGIDSGNWDDYKPPFSFAQTDLNDDNKKETIVLLRRRQCSNRHCEVYIFQQGKNQEHYRLVSNIFASRNGLQIAVLPSKSHGWHDISARVFTYQPREERWRIFKFNGKEYQLTEQKLSTIPRQIILSENSPAFELGSLSNYR